MNKITQLSYIWASILIGLVVGVLTLIGQAFLPGNFNSIANSGAVWLMPAYYLASRLESIKQAIISCILCLIGSVYGYYIFEAMWNNHTFTFFSYYKFLWVVCALIAGTIFGMASNKGKTSQNNFYKSIGKSVLPAVFIAEGLNILMHKKDYAHMINVGYMWIVVSIVLAAISFKKDILKKDSIFALTSVSILGLIFYEIIFIIKG